MTPPSSSRPRVVVLGGGFAGVGAARALKDADVDVVLVDRNDFHTFQPLIYQVATGLLEPSAVGHPLRDLFHDQENARVHQATVTEIDLDAREVRFAEMAPLTYDHLVLGLGAQVNFFGVDGAAEHAFPLYTLRDALRLREHLLARWEAADRDRSLVDDGALNVVVVGGGPTGVESSGAIAELYRHVLGEDYPDFEVEHARIVLVEAGPTLFSMFKPDIQRYAQNALEKRHVEVRTGDSVAKVEPTRVTLGSGEVIPAHTLVWGAGLQGSPLATSLGLSLERGNRIAVEPDLTVSGRPEVSVVGDVAWIQDGDGGHALPQLGSVALQSGECAGENVRRQLAGKDTKPFSYTDKGTMATIGRGAAVIQTRRGKTIKGRSAFLAWGAVHLALLSTGEDRTKAVLNWTWAGLTHERTARIIVNRELDEPAADPARAP